MISIPASGRATCFWILDCIEVEGVRGTGVGGGERGGEGRGGVKH